MSQHSDGKKNTPAKWGFYTLYLLFTLSTISSHSPNIETTRILISQIGNRIATAAHNIPPITDITSFIIFVSPFSLPEGD